MRRRGFLGAFLALPVAPFIAGAAVTLPKPTPLFFIGRNGLVEIPPIDRQSGVQWDGETLRIFGRLDSRPLAINRLPERS